MSAPSGFVLEIPLPASAAALGEAVHQAWGSLTRGCEAAPEAAAAGVEWAAGLALEACQKAPHPVGFAVLGGLGALALWGALLCCCCCCWGRRGRAARPMVDQMEKVYKEGLRRTEEVFVDLFDRCVSIFEDQSCRLEQSGLEVVTTMRPYNDRLVRLEKSLSALIRGLQDDCAERFTSLQDRVGQLSQLGQGAPSAAPEAVLEAAPEDAPGAPEEKLNFFYTSQGGKLHLSSTCVALAPNQHLQEYGVSLTTVSFFEQVQLLCPRCWGGK